MKTTWIERIIMVWIALVFIAILGWWIFLGVNINKVMSCVQEGSCNLPNISIKIENEEN